MLIGLLLFGLLVAGCTSPPEPTQCTFPAGITCVSSKLTSDGNLYLRIGQGTGHSIMVTGVVCTQNTSVNFPVKESIQYSSCGTNCINNITISSGNQTTVANPGAGFLAIKCTDANGATLTGTVGAMYHGKIYINYTETDTGLTRIIVGTYKAKYES